MRALLCLLMMLACGCGPAISLGEAKARLKAAQARRDDLKKTLTEGEAAFSIIRSDGKELEALGMTEESIMTDIDTVRERYLQAVKNVTEAEALVEAAEQAAH